MTELEEKAPTIDELEAIMLADYEGLYHKDAARKMGRSDASCATLTEKLPSVF